MTIREMVKRVNSLTGQGIYDIDDLLPYLDEAIDEINDVLNVSLPPISAVYENNFSKLEEEEDLVYANVNESIDGHEALDNNYGRIHDTYLRNYVCYEVSFRILRDEDEDPEVYAGRAGHAAKWLRKIQSNLGDFVMQIPDTILVNDDVPGSLTEDEYYNPYFPKDDDL